MHIDRLVASPVCDPGLSLQESLAAYSELGFSKFEAFTEWTDAALDPSADPRAYRRMAAEHGMRIVSVHLPRIAGGQEGGHRAAVEAARFADALGAEVAIFKADSRPAYVEAGRRFLPEVEGLGLTPVLQNHAGTPITTIADYREVLEGLDDPRMEAILEVGHFHKAGIDWREGLELLGERIALVHIKDMQGEEPVPFGEGEIDFPDLVARLDRLGYRGDFVVELEGRCREAPMRYMREAVEYLSSLPTG